MNNNGFCFPYSLEMFIPKARENENAFPWPFSFLYGYQLPEKIEVAPAYSKIVKGSTQKNRYISTITVSAIPAASISINLAAEATSSFTFADLASAVSSDTSVATVEVSNGEATITAVAAGSSVVTLTDSANNTIATISVTVA